LAFAKINEINDNNLFIIAIFLYSDLVLVTSLCGYHDKAPIANSYKKPNINKITKLRTLKCPIAEI